jgi:hypothetical protein
VFESFLDNLDFQGFLADEAHELDCATPDDPTPARLFAVAGGSQAALRD